MMDIGEALRMLEMTLRNPEIANLPESKEVRRRLVGIYGRDSVANWEAALAILIFCSNPTHRTRSYRFFEQRTWRARETWMTRSGTRTSLSATIPRRINST